MQFVEFLLLLDRLHKVIWGSHGMQTEEHSAGIVIGGTDNGHIFVYDANKILSDDADNALVLQLDKHTGPVQALDINAFQDNLLASGKLFDNGFMLNEKACKLLFVEDFFGQHTVMSQLNKVV